MCSDKIKVLVVDDEPEICEILQKFLALKGYEVVVAYEGQEAIKRVKTDRPNVVLLDIKMPGISGIDALHKIKEIDPQILVIMVTAVKDEAIGKEAIKMGADDYITKPIDLDYLMTSVLVKCIMKFD